MLKLKKFEILITFCVVLLLCNQNCCLAWRAFKVVLTSFPHEFNTNLLNVKIDVHNNTADTTVDIVMNALKDIDDVTLSYVLAVESDKAANYTILLDRKVHLCKFLLRHAIDNVLRTMYEDILRRGSFIKTCPIKKGSIFTLYEFRVDEELMPQYVPEANFYVDMHLNSGSGSGSDVMVFKGRLYGKIDKSKGFNNLKMFSMG